MAVRVSIGEFSMMTRLSRNALRHYDELGLLEPAQVDPVTGHRHYDTAQVQTAHVIRHFRGLGMPVPEVKAMLAAADVQVRNEVIAAHLGRMETELDKIRETVSTLRDLLDPVQKPLQVEFRSVPSVRAAAISATVQVSEVPTWWRAALDEIDFVVRVAGALPAGPPGGLYAPELFSDEEGAATVFVPINAPVPTSGRVRMADIPPADLAVTVHDGPHNTIGRTYGALGTFVAERRLGVEGPVRENYLIASLDADGDGQQRTEIGWPVYRTSIV